MSDVGRPAPEVYRLSMAKLPFAVGHAWRLELLKTCVVATGVTAVLTALSSTPRDALDAALLVGGVALVAMPYLLWRAGRRVRRHWNAFELAVGAESVRVAARGEGRITIRHDQITSILEGAGGLVVRSTEAGVVVRVPRTVEGYADVRARLAARSPIAPRPEAFAWCAALMAAGLVVAAAVAQPRVPGGVAIGLMLCQGAAAILVAGELRANPELPVGTRALAVVAAVGAALLPVVGLFIR